MNTALRLIELFKYVPIDIFWPKRIVLVNFHCYFILCCC